VLTAVEASDWRLIRKHRRRAVFIAMERLNKSIDRGDRQGRDFWAQVVHEIHDYERSRELAVKEPPVRWPAEIFFATGSKIEQPQDTQPRNGLSLRRSRCIFGPP
jgi:hypothetical protein